MAKKPTKKVTEQPTDKMIAARIPYDTYERIDAYCRQNGIPISNLIRLAIRDYLATQGIVLSQEDFYLGSWGDINRFGSEAIDPEILSASERLFKAAANY